MEPTFNANFDGVSGHYIGFQGAVGSSSLVLDHDRGQLVNSLMMTTTADKALIALRNHSQAERRRRERINAHLATLRTLIPGTNKMDKAALLGEVINQVKLLRQTGEEASIGTFIPSDIDEVKVEEDDHELRASLCCDFRQDLLSDLREAMEGLPSKPVRAEIATLGSRMVTVFVISGDGKEGIRSDDVRRAMRSVLDEFYASEEFSSRETTSGKRRRGSFASSNSSIITCDHDDQMRW